MINAPSLEHLKIVQRFSWFHLSDSIPKLVKANIKLRLGDSTQLLGCLRSAKHLRFCIKSNMISYPTDIFYNLVSLRLCTCSLDWFGRMLLYTPNLEVLKIGLAQMHSDDTNLPGAQWRKPRSVPECLVSSLKTVEWIRYEGSQVERNVAIYILKKAKLLDKFYIKCSIAKGEKKRHHQMELASTPRRSSKCELLFS